MRRKGESRKCEGGSKSHSRGGKKGGDGLNRRRSAVSNDRKSGRGERRERRCRGGSWNLHTLIKLLFGSLALHVSAPSAAPVRPHPHSLCISGITSNSVFSFRWGGGVKKTETKKRSDCGYNLHLTAAPPHILPSVSALFLPHFSPLLHALRSFISEPVHHFPLHPPLLRYCAFFYSSFLFSISWLHFQSVSLLPVEQI